MSDITGSSKKKSSWRQREIVKAPSLSETLKSLEPGDYVHCGLQWGYGTIRETASKLGVRIQTKRSAKGITVLRTPEIPEPV